MHFITIVYKLPSANAGQFFKVKFDFNIIRHLIQGNNILLASSAAGCSP
jgi:hypothetical protein